MTLDELSKSAEVHEIGEPVDGSLAWVVAAIGVPPTGGDGGVNGGSSLGCSIRLPPSAPVTVCGGLGGQSGGGCAAGADGGVVRSHITGGSSSGRRWQ